MVRTISTREARDNLGDVLGSVYYTKEPVVVERHGKAVAVIVSPEAFARLQQEVGDDWAALDRLRARNADQNPDEAYADATAAVAEARRERDGQRPR